MNRIKYDANMSPEENRKATITEFINTEKAKGTPDYLLNRMLKKQFNVRLKGNPTNKYQRIDSKLVDTSKV